MAKYINFCIILIISGISSAHAFLFWGSYQPWDENDHMRITDKLKLKDITMELMADANLKIRQTLSIRETYSGTVPYDVGNIMGKIREKYRHMMEAYRQMKDKSTGRSVNVSPAIRELKPIHFIVSMELVWMIQRQIDKMVNILETTVDLTTAMKTLAPKSRGNRTATNTTEAVNKQQASIETTTVSEKKVQEEQELKRRYREQYLMKRLGLPVNSTTTKKRFINKWPVEDTWNFGPYDDMGNK